MGSSVLGFAPTDWQSGRAIKVLASPPFFRARVELFQIHWTSATCFHLIFSNKRGPMYRWSSAFEFNHLFDAAYVLRRAKWQLTSWLLLFLTSTDTAYTWNNMFLSRGLSVKTYELLHPRDITI